MDEIITTNLENEHYLVSDDTTTNQSYIENLMILENTDVVQIYGTDDQRKEMFADYALYFGEVNNPLKTATNYNKGQYAPLDSVLNALRPCLAKYGFGIIQTPTTSNSGSIVSVQTIITHKSGAMIVCPTLSIPILKPDAQTIIAGSTYARRGALNAQFGVYGEVDDDGEAAIKQTRKPRKDPEPEEEGEDHVNPEFVATVEKIFNKFQTDKEAGKSLDGLYDIVRKHNGGKSNPRAIKDISIAKAVLKEMKGEDSE